MKVVLILLLTISPVASAKREGEKKVVVVEPQTTFVKKEFANLNNTLTTDIKREDINESGMGRNTTGDSLEHGSNNARTRLSIMCKPFDICYSESDCHGGHCLGSFVGTCNCNACIDLWLCKDDSACGGLKGACNSVTKTCDCNAGFKAAGFRFFFDALRALCNRKACTKDDQDQRCFGLPCHFGRCTC